MRKDQKRKFCSVLKIPLRYTRLTIKYQLCEINFVNGIVIIASVISDSMCISVCAYLRMIKVIARCEWRLLLAKMFAIILNCEIVGAKEK